MWAISSVGNPKPQKPISEKYKKNLKKKKEEKQKNISNAGSTSCKQSH
jgi:hypothetical protein